MHSIAVAMPGCNHWRRQRDITYVWSSFAEWMQNILMSGDHCRHPLIKSRQMTSVLVPKAGGGTHCCWKTCPGWPYLIPIAAKANPPWSIGAQSMHGIVILPQYLPAGDYTTANSNFIVDCKDNMLEPYKDFTGSQNRGSPMKMLRSLHRSQVNSWCTWLVLIQTIVWTRVRIWLIGGAQSKIKLLWEHIYKNRYYDIRPCIHMSALFLQREKRSIRQFGI